MEPGFQVWKTQTFAKISFDEKKSHGKRRESFSIKSIYSIFQNNFFVPIKISFLFPELYLFYCKSYREVPTNQNVLFNLICQNSQQWTIEKPDSHFFMKPIPTKWSEFKQSCSGLSFRNVHSEINFFLHEIPP